MSDYYSDRVQGARDRGIEEITPGVWGREAICGCDERAYRLALAAEIPDFDDALCEE